VYGASRALEQGGEPGPHRSNDKLEAGGFIEKEGELTGTVKTVLRARLFNHITFRTGDGRGRKRPCERDDNSETERKGSSTWERKKSPGKKETGLLRNIPPSNVRPQKPGRCVWGKRDRKKKGKVKSWGGSANGP